jgi:hypothetical protein
VEHFVNSNNNRKVKTIGDPALYLKEWDVGSANEEVDDHNTILNHTAKIFVSARDTNSCSSNYHAKCFANIFDEHLYF